MPLILESRFCGNVYIIQCKGRIVAGEELKSLEATLELAVREFTRLVLEVSELGRLDSTGMGLLVRYAVSMRKRGGDLRLASPPPFIMTLLSATRLSSVLQIHATEQEAILSFLQERSAETPQQQQGPRVLLLAESPDLCVFVRTVLTHHGFDVKSTTLFRDAKVLLQVDAVDYILLGPSASQLASETVLGVLRGLAPNAAALHLGADFNSLDAHEATEVLLHMFGAKAAAAP